MSSCDLSIVLPVHNDQDNLNRILAEFLANTPKDNWEVIVVDDGSDSPLTLPSGIPENWTLARYETQKGAAFARNHGVKQARGKKVVLLSVFLKIPADFITKTSAFITNNQFDIAQYLMQKAPDVEADHFQAFLVNQEGRLSKPAGSLPVKNMQFTAALLKRDVFLDAGGFDEGMNHYGGHELDLVYRLDQQGLSKRLVVNDLPLERVKLETHDRVRSRLQEYGHTGLPALLKKHPPLKKTILLYPTLWFLLTLLMIPVIMENSLRSKIEKNIKLSSGQYRLYLHLVVRNAWVAR